MAVSSAAAARTIAHLLPLRASVKRPERRALLAGINAYRSGQPPRGVRERRLSYELAPAECGIDPADIRVVLDDRATTANIMERLHWLLDDVPPDGERVLFYSGHGAQIPSYNFAGEVDRLDECLVPFDFDWNPTHAIRDKQFAELYSQLGYDRHFVAIFDCCHSGGMTRDGGPRVRGLSPPADVRHRNLRWNARLGMWQARKLPTPNPSLARPRVGKDYTGEAKST